MKKEEIKAKALEALADAKAKLQELQSKRSSISADLREDFDQQMAAMKAKKDELEAKLDSMEDKAEEKWEEVKDVLGDSLRSFKEGFTHLGRLFD